MDREEKVMVGGLRPSSFFRGNDRLEWKIVKRVKEPSQNER